MLGSFFWLNGVLHIPGGVLAKKYGTKIVFGGSNLIGSLLCILMPISAFLDYRLLLALRVAQGCVLVGSQSPVIIYFFLFALSKNKVFFIRDLLGLQCTQ